MICFITLNANLNASFVKEGTENTSYSSENKNVK